MIKTCKIHGETEFVVRPDGGARCKKCRSEAVIERRRKVKKELVEYKGGQCEICGYNKCVAALDFHHRDESTKSFGVSDGNTRSLEKAKAEADKCILACANCHREIHDKENNR